MQRVYVDSTWDLTDYAEGSFTWGSCEYQNGIVLKTIKVIMPYEQPNKAYPLHVLPVVLGRPLEYENNEYNFLSSLEVIPDREVRPSWLWNGDEHAPSLYPSIACGPEGALWHGYIRCGQIEAC